MRFLCGYLAHPDNGQHDFFAKSLPTNVKVDLNRMYFVTLKTPLK